MNDQLTLDPNATVLIIQDLQNDVISEGGAFAGDGGYDHAQSQNVVENVARLAAAMRSVGVPVIHVHFVVDPGAPGTKQNADLYRAVKESNALVRVDPSTGQPVARIPIGRGAVEVAAAHGLVWVTLQKPEP